MPPKSSCDLDGALALAGNALDRRRSQPAQPAGGEVAGDALDARRIGTVRREADLDHRIVELGPGGKARPDRRVGRQVDDALMVVGKLELALRQHHAAAFDAADLSDLEHGRDTRDPGAGRTEGANQAGAGIGRAADDLNWRPPVAGIDGENAQLVGIGMLFGRQHAGDDERLQARLVVDRVDLQADRGQPSDDIGQRRLRFEVVLEPGEREFHCGIPSGLGTLLFGYRSSPSGMCTKGSCSRT